MKSKRRHSTAVLAALSMLVVGTTRAATGQELPVDGEPCRPTTHPVRSPWVPDGESSLERDGIYGLEVDDWMAAVGGIGLEGERLFVFDGGDPRVIVLAANTLEPLGEFGRVGQGPGEFEESRLFFPPRYWDFGFLDASTHGVAVYDREAVEVFDPSGTLITRFGGLRGSPLFGTKFISLLDQEHLLIGFDDFDRTGTRPRRLTTVLVSPEGRRELHGILVAEPPKPGQGAVIVPGRQARPLWTRRGACVYSLDGASPFFVRYDLRTARADTLPLPDWTPPENTAREADTRRSVEQAVRARSGFRASLPGPTVLMRWTDLQVDPAGYVWVERWRDDWTAQSEVVIVDPASGDWHEVTVPTFPKAFGPGGVFYGIERIPATDQTAITRYRALVGGR